MSNFVLTDKEVSDLHNAKCYLLYAIEHCEELFKEDSQVVKNLKRSMEYLYPVASRVMKIQDEIRDARWNQAQRIAKNNNFNNSIWSIYEIEDFEVQSSVPVGAKLSSYYSEKTVTVEGPTWLDLWKATDKLIEMTRHYHGDHIFIEAYKKLKSKDNQYEVILGS